MKYSKIEERRNYVNVHYWLIKTYGKAKFCAHCGVLDASRYEWALIKCFKYEKVLGNFIQLCKSCHVKYDMSQSFKEDASRRMSGRKLSERTKEKMSLSAKKREKFNVDNLIYAKAIDNEKIGRINEMYDNGFPLMDICNMLAITKPTIYKYLKNGKNRYSKKK